MCSCPSVLLQSGNLRSQPQITTALEPVTYLQSVWLLTLRTFSAYPPEVRVTAATAPAPPQHRQSEAEPNTRPLRCGSFSKKASCQMRQMHQNASNGYLAIRQSCHCVPQLLRPWSNDSFKSVLGLPATLSRSLRSSSLHSESAGLCVAF